MYVIAIVLISAGVVILLYVLFQVLRFQRIRKRMTLKSQAEFIKKLGKNYKQKEIHSELYRYKWKKGLFIVRADFTKDGKLVGAGKVSLRLFKRKVSPFFA